MNFRDNLVKAVPVPNPNNDQWIYLTASLVGSVSRASNIYTLVFTVYLIYLFLLALFFFKVTVYLIGVYSERLQEQGPHVKVFATALCTALVLGIGGVGMVLSDDWTTSIYGWHYLAHVFCVFALFTAVYDWWADRPVAKALPSQKDVTVTDVVKMKQTMRAAKDKSLVK